MNECSGDSCSASSQSAKSAKSKKHDIKKTSIKSSKEQKEKDEVLDVKIISDIICPWCYIGKARFEKAIALLNKSINVQVEWLPYLLNPYMPKEGMDRKEYRSEKYGWEKSLQMDAQIVKVGKEDGLNFNYTILKHTPNTFEGHRLIYLAKEEDKQNEVVERLFEAYFEEGLDIGKIPVLIQLGQEAGMDEKKLKNAFNTGKGVAEVTEEIEQSMNSGIQGVPFFILNESIAFSGAQSPEIIVEAIIEAMSEK